jgi:SAM-dependent methyltransferase
VSDASTFDGVAAIYDAARPGYPSASVEWLVPPDAGTVVDVGAGTGKFTALLRRPGRTVVAVEPSEGMLAALRRALPDVRAVAGSGERMPLADASADAMIFAQAWHWVDVPRASVEAARVLRPGGTLGLVWNLRDERVDWVRELGVAMRADGDHYRGEDDDPAVDPPFGVPERHHVEWSQQSDRAGIHAMVRSRSYFSLLDDAGQSDILHAVDEVLDRHGLRGSIPLPFVTASFRYRRP